MAPLEELAAFVSQGVRGGVNKSLRAELELHVVDTLGAWVERPVRRRPALFGDFRVTISEHPPIPRLIS